MIFSPLRGQRGQYSDASAKMTPKGMKINPIAICRCGPFPAALEALQQTAVKGLLGSMVTAIYPISEGTEAFEKAKSKGSLKVLLHMEAEA